MLEWAAGEGRVLVSHDRNTLVGHAYDRMKNGRLMPGLLIVARGSDWRRVIDDLLLCAVDGVPSEYERQVRYVPLR